MTTEDTSVSDYSNEDPGKILNSHSLIDAIHEKFDPTTSHDPDYLQLRIALLRDTFDLNQNSNNEHIDAIDNLLAGYGRITPVTVLPFEGALEAPDNIETEAHKKIEEQFKGEIKEIRRNGRAIHREYITYIILHAIEPRLRSKTVTLSELQAAGLPLSDPGHDEMDY